jgi:hypothetical protein
MSTEPATGEGNAFVRIDPSVRDRLRQHCQAQGLKIGRYVSNIITKELDALDNPTPAPPRFSGRGSRRPKSRKKARAKK